MIYIKLVITHSSSDNDLKWPLLTSGLKESLRYLWSEIEAIKKYYKTVELGSTFSHYFKILQYIFHPVKICEQ